MAALQPKSLDDPSSNPNYDFTWNIKNVDYEYSSISHKTVQLNTSLVTGKLFLVVILVSWAQGAGGMGQGLVTAKVRGLRNLVFLFR